MIGRLRGTLIHKHPPELVLDVSGVGYEIEAPMSTFYQLPSLGEPVSLFTHLVVREDAHVLYGFARESERRLFRSLLKVSGVGAKMALAILSGMSSDEFARCVQDGDAASLIRLPGIGKRTAERLIVEMRDRIGTVGADSSVGSAAPALAGQPPGSPVADAIEALVALGYRPVDASRLVRGVSGQGLSSEEIIRSALRNAAGGGRTG